MFLNHIKNAFIRKNIGLYIFSFAILLGQDSSNYSLSFDGQSNYVSLPTNGNLQFINNEITFTAWVKIPSNQATIIGQYFGILGLYNDKISNLISPPWLEKF